MALDFKKLLQKPLVAVRPVPGGALTGSGGASAAAARPSAAAARLPGADLCLLPPVCYTPPLRGPQKEDMPADMAAEAVEIVTSAVDKFLSTENYEVRAAAGVRIPLAVRSQRRRLTPARTCPAPAPRRRPRTRSRRRWTRSSARPGTAPSARASATT